MKKNIPIILFVFLSNSVFAQKTDIESIFKNPPQSAKPWVFWYWLHGAVSKEGITADLEAMKEVGIGGAYLMPIKDTNSKIPFQPQARQLTPEWWALVKFALQEAKRLQLQIGVHVSDGFALAGGPWIQPEMSMQQLTWAKIFVSVNNKNSIVIPQPETKENYYKDIAVYAYPANYNNEIVLNNLKPVVTASNYSDASFLADVTAKQTFRSDSNCWIQYCYPRPVTVRQVKIKKQNNAYQSQRFIIQKSDDGVNFSAVATLQPPRHGWQDWTEPYTHAVKTFTSKYIRFVWKKEGTEPGSEDLDAAKWKTALRVQGIYISDEPVINNYEAKNGSVWRVAASTTAEEVNKTDAVPLNKIINVTNKLSANGLLNWVPPTNENWVIVRIGHTSTGAVNSTAGGGKGLECDKFSAEAATMQFNNWFAKFYTQTDATVAKEVIKLFHIDSWECGSQNWSKNFAAEFKKKRGYDLLPYLLVMTGTPVTDVATSEKILHDVRQTIAELVNDKFYATLTKLAHVKGCLVSAESIAPTFVSDGLLHYKYADIPMGEFWLNSPTHDKPNDMLDAISGAHIYGKNIVQAEAFTTLRSDFGEHPGNLKAVGDRAFASGINKLSLHVFMHNPWLDKKPGMTLDGIGLFYQRDQTWFKQSKAWIDYLTRCQALLQLGKPVVDIGVFTGEELPGRSVLPNRLVNTLPGLFGKEKVEAEKKRLLNEGQPQRTIPDGVTHSANMADPEDYTDALNGYQYDCFNPDVLLQMKVQKGRVVTPGGASYAVLVIPGKHPMNPDAVMSEKVKNKLKQLAAAGAKMVLDLKLYGIKGKNIIDAPYNKPDLESMGIKKDALVKDNHTIAWFHRKLAGQDIYFLSNQAARAVAATIEFPVVNKDVQIWRPADVNMWSYPKLLPAAKGQTVAQFEFAPNESYFVVFRSIAEEWGEKYPVNITTPLNNPWTLHFVNADTATTSFATTVLSDWSKSEKPSVKYYSGTVIYTNTFVAEEEWLHRGVKLIIDTLYNIATVKVNGVTCGTVWTRPYEVDIFRALKAGENKVEIEVTNTWRNRLIGDELQPENRRTWLNSPYQLKDKPLLPAGIVGNVNIYVR